MSTEPHARTYWTAGALRCVLVSTHDPPFHLLQVAKGDEALYSEVVIDDEQAGIVADYLWHRFVRDRE